MNREQLNQLVNDIAANYVSENGKGCTRAEAIQVVADVLNRKPATVRGMLSGHHINDHAARILQMTFTKEG